MIPTITPGSSPSWRFLVGRVDDPIPGTGVLQANGYFDISLPTSIPERIRTEGRPDSIKAQLRLPRTYLHGDTTSTVKIEVLNLAGDAEMNGARADTTFEVGSSATQGTVALSPTNTLLTIDLPPSWLTQARLDDLRRNDAQKDSLNRVHGFKLTTPNTEDVVVGFSSTSAELRLTHKVADTSVTYSSFKTFTHIEQVGMPKDIQSPHKLIQGGTGVGLEMKWNFAKPPLDTLSNDPLNGAQIFVPIDTMEMKSYNRPSFTRPRPKGYRMFVARSSGDSPLRLRPSAAPGAAQVSNDVAFSLFRESLRKGSPVFDALKLFVADRKSIPTNRDATLTPGLPSTLPVLVRTDSLSPGPPRATLTVTPL
ncbi:MAG: hypothetical protein ABEL51_00240 [Salinibacter sp.]